MIAVYSDSIIIDREWIPRLDFHGECTVLHDLSEYERHPASRKFAFTGHRLHVDHDSDIEFETKIRRLSACSLLVFALESELHSFHWPIWARAHRDNVYWLLPGLVNDRPDINSHIIFWGDWFKTTANLYRQLPEKLADLRPHDVKPRYFDALLGSPKPHRDFVAKNIQQHALDDQVIMTYGGKWQNDAFYAQDYFIWEPGCEPMQNIIGTADWVRYHGIQAHLSQVMPLAVYNQTAYSIVAETDHDNTLSFFSEKTAKVLIARRLFVAFTGYRFLSNLRDIGFRTFGDIINESYDLVRKDHERYSAAFEQVRRLCSLPQASVLEAVRDVVEHNHKLIMERDWNRYAQDQMQQLIRSKTAHAG